MGKNIVLFIDGTWNQPRGPGLDTNVRKLWEATEDDASQKKDYFAGVGTAWPPPSSVPQKPASRMRGPIGRRIKKAYECATGEGTKKRITDAYAFLVDKYKDGDNIFLFGFSRGAFAARSLGGFICEIGILLQHRLENVEEAFALYENGTDPRQSRLWRWLQKIDIRAKPNPELGTVLPIHFIGVWDTVAALGLPWQNLEFSAPFSEKHQKLLPSNINHARHALALHELREPFEPLLWTGPSRPGQTIEQVWFPGAHADVGGGNDDGVTHWSDVALRWMVEEATGLGLKLNQKALPNAAPDSKTEIHHNIRGVFAGYKPSVRGVLADHPRPDRTTLATCAVHTSVYRRLLPDGAPPYKFRWPRINRKLREIDQITLKLIRRLDFRHPPDMDARAAVEAFLAREGKASQVQQAEFARAFCLHILCGGPSAIQSFQKTVQQIHDEKMKLLGTPQDSRKLEELQAWGNRLEAIIHGAQQGKSLLPPLWRDRASGLEPQLGKLKGSLLALDFRVGSR